MTIISPFSPNDELVVSPDIMKNLLLCLLQWNILSARRGQGRTCPTVRDFRFDARYSNGRRARVAGGALRSTGRGSSGTRLHQFLRAKQLPGHACGQRPGFVARHRSTRPGKGHCSLGDDFSRRIITDHAGESCRRIMPKNHAGESSCRRIMPKNQDVERPRLKRTIELIPVGRRFSLELRTAKKTNFPSIPDLPTAVPIFLPFSSLSPIFLPRLRFRSCRIRDRTPRPTPRRRNSFCTEACSWCAPVELWSDPCTGWGPIRHPSAKWLEPAHTAVRHTVGPGPVRYI